jgi:hypothetical protein
VKTLPNPATVLTDHRYGELVEPGFFAALAAVSVMLVLRLRRGANGVKPRQVRVAAIKDQGANAAAYLATYLFPFVLLDDPSWQEWGAYGVYMVILAIVTMRSNLILVNPTLYVFGYRVLTIEHTLFMAGASTPAETLLVSRTVPRANELIHVARFADGFIEVQGSVDDGD